MPRMLTHVFKCALVFKVSRGPSEYQLGAWYYHISPFKTLECARKNCKCQVNLVKWFDQVYGLLAGRWGG